MNFPTDPIAAVTHPDPYPYYAQLRAGPPLAYDERLRLWIASRAEVVMEVLAGVPQGSFQPNTPSRLRAARTCYDHMAGAAGVALHDHLQRQGWLYSSDGSSYELTADGARGMEAWGAAASVASPVPAWTGANAARTWAARWALPGSISRCGAAGSSRTWTAGPSRSRPRRGARPRRCLALRCLSHL